MNIDGWDSCYAENQITHKSNKSNKKKTIDKRERNWTASTDQQKNRLLQPNSLLSKCMNAVNGKGHVFVYLFSTWIMVRKIQTTSTEFTSNRINSAMILCLTTWKFISLNERIAWKYAHNAHTQIPINANIMNIQMERFRCAIPLNGTHKP